jgi:predicted nucleotidyltransferase
VFELARQREAVIAWLQNIDVQPLNPDEPTYSLPPLPDLRKIMFAEVLRFVRIARDLPGLQRIALIGSLTSEKEFPKDIDLLVTITGDCDLARLATLGRQLAGRMAAHSAGAEIFLASPDGEYLGRTCPWKSCGPGIRTNCDARSCGRRHYMHDDLQTIQLSKALIDQPPVQLWPETVAVSCPSDVLEQLVQPLSKKYL